MDQLQQLDMINLTTSDYDEVLPLMMKYFTTRESTFVGLHVSEGEAVTVMKEAVWRNLSSGASVGARDRNTGQLVGTQLAGIITPENSNKGPKNIKDKSQLVQLLDLLQPSSNLSYPPSVTKVLKMAMLTVTPEFTGKGMAKWLIQKSEDQGRKLGCTMAEALLTHQASQHISSRLNYTTRHTYDLTDKHKGYPEMDFQAMNGTTEFIFATKEL